MKLLKTKRALAITVAGAVAVVGTGVAALAYFSTSGGGTGTGSVGTSSALVIHQASITYSNAGTDNALLPGTSATVTFTVDNNSSGHQELGTISVASISADALHPLCDTSAVDGWFSTTTDVVNHDYGAGTGQLVSGNLTVTFNDLNVPQDGCKGAALTFTYAA